MRKILIDGKQYNHSWLFNTQNKDAQALLRRHYKALNRPVCNCLSDLDNRELTIRKCNYFFLARMPNTGKNHAEYCSFFGENDSPCTANGETWPGIVERNGKFDINLDSYLTLEIGSQSSEIITQRITPQTSCTSRSTTTLLGLKLFLFNNAKINHWNPDRLHNQSFSNVRKLASEVANKTVIEGVRLSKMLFMPEWVGDAAISKKSNQKALLKRTSSPGKASIVIGIVNRLIGPSEKLGRMGVSLNLMDDLLWMYPEMATRAKHSFGQLISEINKSDRYILAICTVFRSGTYYTIGDIAFMRVSKQFIPVDSSYELMVANSLVEKKRRFSKPLCLEGAVYMSDFILTDCKKNVFMEVFGVENNPEYQVQKEKKLIYFFENGILCWQWTPKDGDMPSFPEQSEIKINFNRR